MKTIDNSEAAKIEKMANQMVECLLEECDPANINTAELYDYAKANYRANNPEPIFNAVLKRATSILCQGLKEAK